MTPAQDTNVGGYRCPVEWCPVREVVPSLIGIHVRRDHPELKVSPQTSTSGPSAAE